MLGLLGTDFEACGADIADVGEEYGHRVLRVVGEGAKVVLLPLPPAGGSVGSCDRRPGQRCGLAQLLRAADGSALRDPSVTAAGADLGGAVAVDASSHAAPHLGHHRARCWRGSARCADRRPPRRPRITMRYDRARKTSTATPTTSWLRTWPAAHDQHLNQCPNARGVGVATRDRTW